MDRQRRMDNFYGTRAKRLLRFQRLNRPHYEMSPQERAAARANIDTTLRRELDVVNGRTARLQGGNRVADALIYREPIRQQWEDLDDNVIDLTGDDDEPHVVQPSGPSGHGNYTFSSYNGPLDYGYTVGTGTKFDVKDFGSKGFCRKCMDQGCYHCAEDKSYIPRNSKRKIREMLRSIVT